VVAAGVGEALCDVLQVRNSHRPAPAAAMTSHTPANEPDSAEPAAVIAPYRLRGEPVHSIRTKLALISEPLST